MGSVLLFWIGSIVLTIACGYYGSVMGYERSVGPWGGLAFGLFLGPIGLLFLLLFPRKRAFGSKRKPVAGQQPVSASGGPPPPRRR